MFYLVVVTLIWSLSFNVIGTQIAGQVDSYFAVLSRVVIALLIFLPFTRLRGLPLKFMALITLSGVFQFGLTYLCLYLSFTYLTVAEVLLFTVLTPLHISLLDQLLRRQFQLSQVWIALLAVLGAAIIRWQWPTSEFWQGFWLLQLANFSFAVGMVCYRSTINYFQLKPALSTSFSLFFIGALAVVLPAYLLLGNSNKMPSTPVHYGSLLFLGLFATALGQYWWNKGSTQVNIGVVAAMNNATVPVGILINIVVFHQQPQWLPFIAGSILIIAALYLNQLLARNSAAKL